VRSAERGRESKTKRQTTTHPSSANTTPRTPEHKTRVETRPTSRALGQSPTCPVRRSPLARPAALADMRQQLSPTATLSRMPQRKTFPPQRPSPSPSPARREARALCPTMTPRTLATTMTPPMPAPTSTRPASPAASHCVDSPPDTSSRKSWATALSRCVFCASCASCARPTRRADRPRAN
jgi:hypothetical protein